MNERGLVLAALPCVLLACPASVIDGGHDLPHKGATSSASSSATSGTGGSATSGTSGTGGMVVCMPGATASCYDGPTGTDGVGVCKAGAQTCAIDGMSWGPCMGEVVPQTENCASGKDQDCDGVASPCKGTLLWAKRFGDAGEQHATGVTVDAQGNVVLTGYFSGAIDFGGGVLTSAGGSDVFVVKLDGSGNHKWSKSFGDPSDQQAFGVAVDNSGNVVVSGTFGGSIDFGGGPRVSMGGSNVFVAKLASSSGAHMWSESFGDASTQGAAATSVAVDVSGNVLLTGNFAGSIDFGGGSRTSAGGKDAFVVKLDGSGAHRWSVGFGDGSYQTGASVAADGAGAVLLLGYYGGSIDFGGGPLPSTGFLDVFLAQLDATGDHAWSHGFGDASHLHYATSVAVASDGASISTGYFSGAIDFGGGALTSKANAAVFLDKLDTGGNLAWSKAFGDVGDQRALGVAVDQFGSIGMCGGLTGQVDFGGGPLASLGGWDVFVAKLDAGGGHLWSKRFGDTQDQACVGVAADNLGNVLVTGDFAGSIDFGGGPLMSAGGTDIFVAKFAP